MRCSSLAFLAFTVWLVPLVRANDSTFVLEAHSLTPYTCTYLGNGEIGVSSSAMGTQTTECFMAGVYDHAAGDVPRIAVLPAWNGVDVYDGLNWLNDARSVEHYSQTLDMYDGILHTGYEIGKVVSVKESLIGISNDPYTNAVAKKNLDLAITASTLLNKPVNPKWRDISSKMYLPRQALLLFDYPLELPLSTAGKRSVAETALAHPPEGAMMGVEFLPILAAEIGDRSLLDALMPRTYKLYVRPPFNVLPETPTNENINFITGAGAFLQQFLYGYTGLRLSDEGLTRRYKPLLPSGVNTLVLRNITVRGRRRDIEIRK